MLFLFCYNLHRKFEHEYMIKKKAYCFILLIKLSQTYSNKSEASKSFN